MQRFSGRPLRDGGVLEAESSEDPEVVKRDFLIRMGPEGAVDFRREGELVCQPPEASLEEQEDVQGSLAGGEICSGCTSKGLSIYAKR